MAAQHPMPMAAVVRPVRGRLQVRTPYRRGGSRALLQDACPRGHIEHVGGGVWTVPRARLLDVVAALARYWPVAVALDVRQGGEQCDTRCIEALGDDCVCACGGANHGGLGGRADWIQVGATTLIAPGEVVRTTFVVPKNGGA